MITRSRSILSTATVAILCLSFLLIPICSAYVSMPVQSGLIYDQATGNHYLAANYAALTRYDATHGDTDCYFFPGVVSHSSRDNPIFFIINSLKITVTGTKPDGSIIDGLEFSDLGWYDSPHDSGSSWDQVLNVLKDTVINMIPHGAQEYLKNGMQSPDSGTGNNSTAAWVVWNWDRIFAHVVYDKGLQFRFKLHCDPDLHGAYTVKIQYYVDIWWVCSGCAARAAEQYAYDTITYFFGSTKLTISANPAFGGTTNPAPGIYTYNQGSSVTVKASAYSGYTFEYWVLEGTTVSYSNPITVTTNSDHTLKATFFDPGGGGGGGCPYVYNWNGSSFVKDNNLLPASEDGNGTDTKDYYRLEQQPVPIIATRQTTLYALQIREFEQEIDYFDQVKLIAVDHSRDTNIAVTPEGEILTYTDPANPISCNDNHGTDRLSEIATMNGNINDPTTYFQGYKGDSLVLNFGKVTDPYAKLIIRDDQKCTNELCINLQVPDGKGGWLTIEVLNPRDLWSMEAVDMSAYVPKTGDFKIRLLWTSTHRLDYVGLDTSSPVQVKKASASPILAVHSTLGDVRAKLAFDDQECVKLVSGQQITMTFTLPNNVQDTTRDFILYTNGYYYTIKP